jgi:glutaminyl-tRNA synthetase
LAPGQLVRLKSAYIIKCESVTKDENGHITGIHCTYLPESKSGHDTSELKVKGTIHWLNAKDAIRAEVRLYNPLFNVENPASEEGDFKDFINPDSLQILPNALIEPQLAKAKTGDHFQFLRNGYFCADKDSKPGMPVFNRTVTLKDSFKSQEIKK